MAEIKLLEMKFIDADQAFAGGFDVYRIIYGVDGHFAHAQFSFDIRTKGDFAGAERSARAMMHSMVKEIAEEMARSST